MKIKFEGTYKSLSNFESEELTSFVLITGKNGSGKSQLIHCLNETYNPTNNQSMAYKANIDPPAAKVQVSDLIYKGGRVSGELVKQKQDEFIKRFESLSQKLKNFYQIAIDNDLEDSDFRQIPEEILAPLVQPESVKDYFIGLLTENNHAGIRGLNNTMILNRVNGMMERDRQFLHLLKHIKDFKDKKLDGIETNDFRTVPMLEKFVDSTQLFSSQIETIFFSYLKRRHDNDYAFYKQEKRNRVYKAMSDEEFEKLFPAPWDIMNKILTENKIPIRVKTFSIDDYNEYFAAEVMFFKEGVDKLVSFNDLSSGEQVIMGLIIKLFTSDYYKKDLSFPSHIILDEPDAFLHPEMSRLLIDVLYKSFVQRLGINVIMTTHSPATVALAPEECIYELQNHPHCRLFKITKDDALSTLTGFLPTLSIDYKNHKQVFVESPTDVSYYQKLFNKINEENPLDYKLYFISNQMGKGNCDWVINIVQQLRSAGLQRAYGIIDWDGSRSSSGAVIVHGEQKRYSIENFLYDPIYLLILFLELRGVEDSYDFLGVDSTFMPYNAANFSAEKIQQIWDWVIQKLCAYSNVWKAVHEAEIVYANGIKVQVPKWFLTTKGHDIESYLRKAFLSLQKFRDEGTLQEELSKIMARCYPLVPEESVTLIRKIAGVNS
jgi:predicted ATPase